MNAIDTSTIQGKIAVMQAHADGKPIQVNITPEWMGITKDYETWDWSKYDYRIKPFEPFIFPEGYVPHNPHGLTPEQVGEEYRLLCTLEVDGRHVGVADGWMGNFWGHNYRGNQPKLTYRVPRSTPLPPLPKQKKKVPLTKDDINILTDLFRFRDEPDWHRSANSININHVWFGSSRGFTYSELRDQVEIKRPGEDWKPCWKEVDA